MRFRPWKKKRGPETPERQPNDAEADGGCQKRCGPSPKTRYCVFCVGIGADRPGLVARETPAVLMSILAHHRRSGRVAFEWQPSLSSSCPLTVRTPHSLKNTQTLVLQTNRIPMVSTQNSTTLKRTQDLLSSEGQAWTSQPNAIHDFSNTSQFCLIDRHRKRQLSSWTIENVWWVHQLKIHYPMGKWNILSFHHHHHHLRHIPPKC